MKSVSLNSSIEAEHATIISRKIVPGGFFNKKPLGNFISYKCSRNSEAHVDKELSPKKPKWYENSRLDLGDNLECDSLYVAINAIRPYPTGLTNHTGTHKAQIIKSKKYTMARIEKMISNIPPKLLDNPLILAE